MTFFLRGCPLSCWWCHNPEGLREVSPEGNGDEKPSNGVGDRRISVDELLREVAKEQVFLDESGGGVTFSGGEPMMQLDFLDAALEACRRRDIHTVVDTSGYAPVEAFELVAGKVDLFLYDLKVMDEESHLRFTGVSNQLIHENLRLLIRRNRAVSIRVPVVPGMTDTEENIEQTMEFLERTGGITEVCLLPYHKAAAAKYSRLQMINRMDGVESPSQKRMETLRARFEQRGFETQIGG